MSQPLDGQSPAPAFQLVAVTPDGGGHGAGDLQLALPANHQQLAAGQHDVFGIDVANPNYFEDFGGHVNGLGHLFPTGQQGDWGPPPAALPQITDIPIPYILDPRTNFGPNPAYPMDPTQPPMVVVPDVLGYPVVAGPDLFPNLLGNVNRPGVGATDFSALDFMDPALPPQVVPPPPLLFLDAFSVAAAVDPPVLVCDVCHRRAAIQTCTSCGASKCGNCGGQSGQICVSCSSSIPVPVSTVKSEDPELTQVDRDRRNLQDKIDELLKEKEFLDEKAVYMRGGGDGKSSQDLIGFEGDLKDTPSLGQPNTVFHHISTPPMPHQPRLSRDLLEQFEEWHTPESGKGIEMDLLGLGVDLQFQVPVTGPNPLGNVPGAGAPNVPQVHPHITATGPNLLGNVPVAGIQNTNFPVAPSYPVAHGQVVSGSRESNPLGNVPSANANLMTNAQIMAIQASRMKESDFIIIPKEHPNCCNLRAWWRTTVTNTSTATGGLHDSCYIWMYAVETLTFEQLGDPTPFQSIDSKLGTGLQPHFQGKFQRWLDNTTEELRKQGKISRGRQMAWKLYTENKPEVETMGVQAQNNAHVLNLKCLTGRRQIAGVPAGFQAREKTNMYTQSMPL